jgi:hypothetical protein
MSMSTVPLQLRPPKVDVAIDLVGNAWKAACLANGQSVTMPTAILPIKHQRIGGKSGVYRLEGAGEEGTTIIAKRCARSTAVVERTVYEQVLTRVGVSRLKYYGYWQEPTGAFGWLFLEDAGQTKLTLTDGVLVAQWLARLHTEAAALVDEVPLPERGPAHYLEHLRSGRDIVGMSLEELDLAEEDRSQLHALQRAADEIEKRWDSICAICSVVPRTLVHGDLSGKNLRLRLAEGTPQLMVLDWETAGWGPPAADLPYAPTRFQRPPKPGKIPGWNGTVLLDDYAACAPRLWGSRARDLERLARLGNVFRAVAGARWAAEQLRAGSGMRRLSFYVEALPRALAALDR